ncbi:hypothetical protein ACFWWU_36490 [Streptomyces sp. NPDC058650]|uniref:hypothetical protein n=1 Tax=Streptomyces sp. NPDC058650 TaxID=3346575 RepID=UPI00365C138B
MARAIVNTPVEGFTGIVVGVAFVNGTADVDEEAQLAYFERQGYEVIYAPTEPEVVEIPDGDPVEAWSGKQLKAYAEREQLDIGSAKSKAEIAAALVAAKAEKVAKAAEAAQSGSQE